MDNIIRGRKYICKYVNFGDQGLLRARPLAPEFHTAVSVLTLMLNGVQTQDLMTESFSP